ncbi:MAG: hypothetical protein KDI42_10280, partial [Gammaproteobacteria bacterium]|nr:hypothetical protein [Gammaproteobacteria bacterium]
MFERRRNAEDAESIHANGTNLSVDQWSAKPPHKRKGRHLTVTAFSFLFRAQRLAGLLGWSEFANANYYFLKLA